MKTPEEIKKGLAVCATLDGDCENCPYDGLRIFCSDRMRKDALAYIQKLEAGIDHAEKVAREAVRSVTENLDKLESRLTQVERERDALMFYVPRSCLSCKHEEKRYECTIPCKWEWRGPCLENTKEGENV